MAKYGPSPKDTKVDRFAGIVSDPFIEYGPGGRDLNDARKEKGVREGVSTTSAEGVDSRVETFSPKND